MAETQALSGDVRIATGIVYNNTGDDDVVAQDLYQRVYTEQYSDGDEAFQAHVLYHDRYTLEGGANVVLDLTSISNRFGDAAFETIRGLLIVNRTTTAGCSILVGGGTAPWDSHVGAGTHTIRVGAGGMFYLSAPVDGYAVTPDTADNLKITNESADTPVTFDIALIGTGELS